MPPQALVAGVWVRARIGRVTRARGSAAHGFRAFEPHAVAQKVLELVAGVDLDTVQGAQTADQHRDVIGPTGQDPGLPVAVAVDESTRRAIATEGVTCVAFARATRGRAREPPRG